VLWQTGAEERFRLMEMPQAFLSVRCPNQSIFSGLAAWAYREKYDTISCLLHDSGRAEPRRRISAAYGLHSCGSAFGGLSTYLRKATLSGTGIPISRKLSRASLIFCIDFPFMIFYLFTRITHPASAGPGPLAAKTGSLRSWKDLLFCSAVEGAGDHL